MCCVTVCNLADREMQGYSSQVGGVDVLCNSVCKRSMVPAPPNFIRLFFFKRTILKGLTFGLCLYNYNLYNLHVLFCIPACVRFELVKSPEVTLCG